MKFELFLLALVLACCVLAQAQSTAAPKANEITTEPEEESHSLFGSFFRPLFKRAKALFGEERIDAVRLQAYKVFLRLYNKTYPPEEMQRRAKIFFDRRKEIEASVHDFLEGKALFSMGENAFTDWDEEELKKLAGVSPPHSLSELSPEEREVVSELSAVSRPKREAQNATEGEEAWQGEEEEEQNLLVGAEIPTSRDWRETGCVSTPINQLKCGACYAIATMSVVESMRCLNTASSPTLSPQHIVDCATTRAGYQNFGCDGGWPTRVLKYLQDTGVATRESCYPFVRRQQTCQVRTMKARDGCTVNASPTGKNRIQYKVLNNERDILYHVANTGPVVTVMKASDKFLYYSKGIFDDPRCSRRRDDVDHAIVIVGYGRENNVNYWLIKNSWGTTTWGEGGYGKYKRGTNACSIGHWGWVVTG